MSIQKRLLPAHLGVLNPLDFWLDQILHHRPDIPVIICTGFSKRISSELASSLGIRALSMKPVTVQEFSPTLRDVLDQPADGRTA